MRRLHAIAIAVGLSCAALAVAQTAMAIARNADLNFGKVIPGASAGTVTVAPDGTRTASGGATLANGTSVSAAEFTVSGDALKSYSITLPSSTTLSSGSNQLVVDGFASSPSGTGTIGLAGTQTLKVGASVQLSANQPTGAYSGTFTVLVSYQ